MITAQTARIEACQSDESGSGVLDKPEEAFAAPGDLKTARVPLNEASDDYPLIVARLNEHWRVIDSKCGIQWILQRRNAGLSASWRGSAFCRTRDGLLSNIRERCGEVSEAGFMTGARRGGTGEPRNGIGRHQTARKSLGRPGAPVRLDGSDKLKPDVHRKGQQGDDC